MDYYQTQPPTLGWGVPVGGRAYQPHPLPVVATVPRSTTASTFSEIQPQIGWYGKILKSKIRK